MANRKQRARRAKTFRHEYGFVTYDEEGNEIEVEREEIHPKKETPARQKATAAKGASKGGRMQREPQPPSWGRSVRRGGVWGGLTIAVSVLLLRGTALPVRILIGGVYAAMFIPLTYWLDGLVYRRHERRKAGDAGRRPRRTR